MTKRPLIASPPRTLEQEHQLQALTASGESIAAIAALLDRSEWQSGTELASSESL
jgi:hypothetical protein